MRPTSISVLALTSLSLGCGGFSLREQMIRSHLPEVYKAHKSGIVAHPTDEDVTQAIKLGQMSKDDEYLLQYAYKQKPGEYLYVDVKTPLFFIAQHSFQRASIYKLVDPNIVQAFRESRRVGISVSEVYAHDVNFSAVTGQQYFILLRDGVRVEPMSESPAIPGGSSGYVDTENFYPVEELIKPGKFEVAYRLRQTGNLFAPGGSEAKYGISLSGIR